jgi:hypothetical protein
MVVVLYNGPVGRQNQWVALVSVVYNFEHGPFGSCSKLQLLAFLR